MKMIFLFLLTSFLSACENDQAANDNDAGQPLADSLRQTFPYLLEQPDQTVELAAVLQEISGLTTAYENRFLATVSDETGVLYLLDPASGQINQTIPFWKDGDFEGIEFIGPVAYVVKSTGNLYRVEFPGTEGQVVTKVENFLDKTYDVEGLGYDPLTNSLLVGCKGPVGETKRAVFAFDLKTQELNPKPRYLLLEEDLLACINQLPPSETREKLRENLYDSQGVFNFGISALAVEPATGNIFVLSSPGKILAVLNREGAVIHLIKLKKKTHPQPEGICFGPDGDLFMASEGRDGAPLLHRFSRKM